MKILLTGATGFLGSHLAKAFVTQGHELLIFKRTSSDTNRISSILDQLIAYDIEECKDLRRPFLDHGSIDAVVHTATCYGRRGESVSKVFQTNTMFPLKLLETAVFFNVGTFLNTDTVLYRHLNAYALSKKQFTEWGRQFASSRPIRLINLKLEHMYGPGDDDSKFVTQVVRSCLAGVPELKFTLGKQVRDFIYINDVISAYSIILDQITIHPGGFHEYPLGSGNPVSIRHLVETVCQLTGTQTKLMFGALPYREHEIMHSQADTTLLELLGWQCHIPLQEGLKRMIEEEKRR